MHGLFKGYEGITKRKIGFFAIGSEIKFAWQQYVLNCEYFYQYYKLYTACIHVCR